MDHSCNWGNSNCPPLTPFIIRFNNPLDTRLFAEEMVSVSPQIPGITVNINSDTIIISGETKGQTTYTVTLSANLKDVFGQALGEAVTPGLQGRQG